MCSCEPCGMIGNRISEYPVRVEVSPGYFLSLMLS